MGATCTSAGHTFPLAICGNDSPSRKKAKRSKLLPAYFGVPLRDLVRYERTYLGIVSPKDLAHFPPLMDEKPSSKASMPEEDANRDLALVESQVAVARGLTLSVHRITPPHPDKVKASGEQNQVFCEGAVDYVPLFLQAVAFWWGSEANATNNTQSTTAPLQAAVPNVVMDRSALATRPEMWAALVETHVNSLVPGNKYKKQLRKASAGARKSSESKVKRWFGSAFKQRGERPRMDFLKLKIERDEYRRQHQVPSATMPVDPLPAEEALRTLTGARLFEETMTLFYPPVTRGEGIPPPCALRLLRVYLQRLPEPLVPLSCTNLLETYLGTVGYLNSEDDTDVEDGAPHQKPDSTGVMLTVDEILRSNFAHIRPTAYCTMVFLLRLLRSHRLTLTDSDMVPVLVDSIRSQKSPRVIQYLLSHHIHELQLDAVVTEDRSVQEAWSEVSETIPLDVPISAEVTREAEADAGSGTSGKEVREGDDDDAVVSAARAVPAEETASAGGEKADLQALPARRRRRRTRQPGHTGEGTSNAEESSILPDNSQSSAAADEAPVANSTAPLAPEVLPEAIEERVATATVVEVAESKPKPVANVEADEKERTDCKVSMPQSPDTRLTMESDDASSCSSAFPCAPQLAATAVAKRDEATKRPTKSILRMQPPSDDDTTTDDLSEADNAAAETCVTATTQAGTQSSLPTLLDGTALSPLRHSDGVNTTMPPASSVGESGLNLPTSTPASPEPEKLLSEKSSPQLLPAPVLLPPAMSTPPPPPLEVPAVPSSAPELPSHSLSVEEEEDLVGVGHAISHHTGKSLPSPYKEVKGLAQRRPSFAGSASQTDTVNIADISPVKRNNSSILPPSQMEEEEEFQGFKLHSHSTSQNTPLPTRAPHSSGSNPVTGASATPSSPSSGSFHPISTDAPTAAITGPLAIPVALATQPMPVVASDAQKGVVLPAPTPHPLVNTDSVHPAGVRLTPTKLDNNLKLSSQGSHSTPAETSAPNRLPLWTDRNVRAVLPSVEPLRVQKENRCLAALLEAKQRFIGNTPRGHLSRACLSPPRAAQTVSTSPGATPPKQLVDAMTEMADEDVELLKSSSAKPTRASAVAAATQTADQSTAAAPAAQAVMQADQGTGKLQELTDELQHIRAQMERRELQHKEAQMVVQEVTARCAELERERISSERDRRVEAAKLRELQMFVDQCKGDQTKLRMELANVQTQSALLRQALVTVH